MLIQPYLFFEGRCEEALALYAKVAGAQVEMLMRYKDNPETPSPGMVPPDSGDKVMHCAFRIGDSVLMASDGDCSGKPDFDGFRLSLTAKDTAEAERVFRGLSEGGAVQVPLTKTFFSPCFGMFKDRFGLGWMIIVHP
jgi:PhnB protein